MQANPINIADIQAIIEIYDIVDTEERIFITKIIKAVDRHWLKLVNEK